jgi:molybdopterin synthase catalytic subunit
MFQISEKPLEHLDLHEGLVSPQAGAFNCFEGRVRDHNAGQAVIVLEYEAYAALCQSEAQKIFQETGKKFSVIAMKCVHRVGRLRVGDMAVWIGVMAAHRDDSFRACRYIIDEVKARLPIWKKEYYENGDSGWVGCPACGMAYDAGGSSPAVTL